MPGEISKPLSTDEQRGLWKRAFLVGAFRALDLARRMPAEFKRRGWTEIPDVVILASTAVCLVKLGGLTQRLRLPTNLGEVGGEWAALGDACPDGRASADKIVDTLHLEHLIDPP